MIGLAIRFAGGRYHATPWGTHVNEAAVEWPPSPWRLLRALTSSWHRIAPDVPRAEIGDLLDALATPPRYRLPAATPAHTRHYMPDGYHRRDVRLSQNLVFDAFLRLEREDALLALWKVDLPASGRELLRRLAGGVTYLGRSESWCDVEVVEEGWDEADVLPVTDAVAPDREVVRLLGVTRPLDSRILDVTTADLQGGRQRRRDPPGTVWLRYARPREWSRTRARRGPRNRTVVARFVLWALDSRPTPLLTRVEEVVRAVRERVALAETDATGRLQVLAYPSAPEALPVRLDRVALWAERGLDRFELDRACRLGPFRAAGVAAVQVPLLLQFGLSDAMEGPLFGPGRRWRSITPLVPWRAPAEPSAVAACVAGLVDRPGARVQPTVGPVCWLEFRQGGAVGARLEFAEPVAGPIVARGQRPGFGLFLCEP